MEEQRCVRRVLRHGVLRVRMRDCVMKFAYAWSFAGEPRYETPAPLPGKRAPASPRLRACRALLRQTGKRIFRAMLAVFRTGRRQRLAFGEHVPGPGLHLAAQPKRHNRRLSYPPHRTRHALEICIGLRLSHDQAPAILRGLGWAASPQPEIGSNLSNGGLRASTQSIPPYGRERRDNATKARLFLGRSQEPVLGQLQRLAPPRAPPDANWQRPAALP